MSLLLLLAVQSMSGDGTQPVAPPPAPRSVQVPNLQDGQPLGDERKFVVFYRGGVSLDGARADLRFCFRYALVSTSGEPTNFYRPDSQSSAAGPAASPTPPVYDGGNYGLMGLAIGSIVDGPLERSRRQMNMMQCMLPRGYDRYRVSESLWKSLNGSDSEAAIEVQAQIASGPIPPTPKVIR